MYYHGGLVTSSLALFASPIPSSQGFSWNAYMQLRSRVLIPVSHQLVRGPEETNQRITRRNCLHGSCVAQPKYITT